MSTDSFNTNYFIALFSGRLHWSAGRSWRRCHSLSKLIDLLLDLWQRQALSSNIPTTSAHDPNRYPPNGVWGNQRVLGGARKVLEEGGWSFPGLAQAPGSKHFNPLFYFLKRKYPITQWRPILNDSLHQTTYKSEENLRRGRPKLHADLFGIEGSFRKLDIDWSGFYWFSLFGGFSITYLKYDTGSERWLFTTFILFWLNTRFLKILVLFISNFVNHIQ